MAAAMGSQQAVGLAVWETLARERVRGRITGQPERPVTVGGHRIERVLGSGGMGVVYAAVERESGLPIALKMLNDDHGRDGVRLQREFRAVSDLFHPHLVAMYELGSDPHGLYFTMELVDGDELLAHCAHGACDQAEHERRISTCLTQLCDAIEYLHGHDLLHGDIKPQNCMVDRAGRLVLLDFGLSSANQPHALNASELGAGAAVPPGATRVGGTPSYMAPELFARAPRSRASDVYAIGVLVQHMLTGCDPFAALSPAALLAGKLAPVSLAPALRPSSLTERLQRVCAQMMAVEPGSRPELAALRRVLDPAPPARVIGPRAPRAIPFV